MDNLVVAEKCLDCVSDPTIFSAGRSGWPVRIATRRAECERFSVDGPIRNPVFRVLPSPTCCGRLLDAAEAVRKRNKGTWEGGPDTGPLEKQEPQAAVGEGEGSGVGRSDMAVGRV